MNDRLKKFLVVFIFVVLAVPFAVAEDKKIENKEVEVKKEKKFKPVFEFSIFPLNSQSDYAAKTKETISYVWNVPADLKVGVDFKVIEMLTLTPYIKYTTESIFPNDGDKGSYGNILSGVGATVSILKDLELLIDLGFTAELGYKFAYRGLYLGTGINYKIEKIFLDINANDEVLYRVAAGKNEKFEKKINRDIINNNFEMNAVFNFFRFFLPKFDAGLYSHFDIENIWFRRHLKDPQPKIIFKDTKIIFNSGFIVKPIDLLTLKTGVKLKTFTEYKKVDTEVYKPLDEHQYLKLGMFLYGDVEFGNATAELSYVPYFLVKKKNVTVEGLIEHHINLKLTYKY